MRAATTAPVVATAPRPALVVSTVANLAIQLDAIGMFAVYPEILRVFSGTPEATLSWVLNAYTIASAAFIVPAGRLADRFGRRVLCLTGTILYGLGAGLCGITPNPELLIAARIMQGLGAAMVIPTSLALVLVAFPSNRRAGAVNQWVAGGAIGGVIAPTLGGLIITTIGWRWFLSLSLLLGLLAFVFGRRYLVDSERDVCEPIPDILGLILLIAGLSLLALGIVRPDGLAVGGVGRTLTIALGGGVMGLFGLRSVRVPHPAISLSLLADPVRALASVAMLVFGITFTAMFLGWNLFLTRQWHFTSFEAGLAITLGPVTAMLTATVARRLADKFGHRSLLLPGAATYSASGILLVQAVAGIIKENRHHSFALVQKVLEKSPSRIESDCPIFPQCGGCSYRHITYEEELALKRKLLMQLPEIGPHISNETRMVSASPNESRNHAQIQRRNDVIGFFQIQSNEIVRLPNTGCRQINQE